MSAPTIDVAASEPHPIYGYRSFKLGEFEFRRDEYFTHIRWPKGSHTMDVSNFLRALLRDVAWGFFYGWVHFDPVFGTCNHYGTVDVYAGTYNGEYVKAGIDYLENHPSDLVSQTFKEMVEDWTNEEFDPFVAPQETGSAYGPKRGNNPKATSRVRQLATRCVGLKDDLAMRTDANGYTVNRAFADVPQDQPEIHAEPGFENEVHAFNLHAYLSRSDVTWNPSFTSVVKYSYMCPTTEEHILPVIHGNDRVEWFFQMSDEIHWNVGEKIAGNPRARVIMKAGDIAAMPADCRHQGYSPKRSMLLVWENGSPKIVYEIQQGLTPVNPVAF